MCTCGSGRSVQESFPCSSSICERVSRSVREAPPGAASRGHVKVRMLITTCTEHTVLHSNQAGATTEQTQIMHAVSWGIRGHGCTSRVTLKHFRILGS